METESNPNSVYYQAIKGWLETEKTFFWLRIPPFLLVAYVFLIALVVFALWNCFVRPEVKRRQQAEALLRESEQRFQRAIAQTEIALRESEERYRRIYDQAAVGLAETTFEGQFINVNPRFGEMLGYSRQELLAKTVLEITHPDDCQLMSPAVQRLQEQEISYFVQEKRYLRKDGSYFWSSTAVSLVRDAAGIPQHTLAVIRDISDRKQAEIALKESEQRFRNMVANVPGAIFRYVLHPDGSDRVIYMSPSCYDLWEVEAKAVMEDAQLLWQMIHPEDLAGMYESVMVSSRNLQPWFWQWRITTPSGKRKWLEGAGHPHRQENGDVVWDTVIMDITNHKNAEVAWQESEERLRLVTENMSDLVCLHHPDGKYQYVTPSSQNLLGYSPEELIGRDPYELFHPDDRDRIRQQAHRMALMGIAKPITYRIRQKTGDYIWVETLTQTILDRQGQVKHLQTTSRDVSERIEIEKQLKHDALHDGLTGLPNRSLLMERLALALKRTKRHPEVMFAVLFLDLDNFKMVNDSLGHSIGDELLLAVARLLTALIRETDLATRLGGDEFIILLEEIEDIKIPVQVAERILATWRSPLQLAEREVFTNTSIGIVLGTSIYNRSEDILRDADLAMYRAKQSGPGQYAIFDPTMHF